VPACFRRKAQTNKHLSLDSKTVALKLPPKLTGHGLPPP
jgi:hypothetical protein